MIPEAPPATHRATFWRVLGFLRPYKLTLFLSLALALVRQLAQLTVPLLTGLVVAAIQDDNRDAIPWLIAGVLGVGLVKGLSEFGRRLISGVQALGVDYDMRNGLYSKLVRLSFGYFDRQQTGQLMSRATVDLQSVRFFLGYGLIFFFQHVLTIVGVTAVMLYLNWQLALVALAVTPLIVVIAYRYSHVSHPILRDVQQQLGEVATVAEESIVGVHVVKAFAQEERRQAQFEHASGSVFDATVRAFRQRSGRA